MCSKGIIFGFKSLIMSCNWLANWFEIFRKVSGYNSAVSNAINLNNVGRSIGEYDT